VAREALGDADPAVRAAALGALARSGALTVAVVRRCLADPSPVVRRRACEVSATWRGTGTATLRSSLRAAAEDADPLVAESACWALGEHADRRATGLLARLATGHPDARCRESAVAALGAIGDPAGLPAVLACLADRPAVRRRAAVALAAFAAPEADEALRRCLEDRDWQVREVAEILLAGETLLEG